MTNESNIARISQSFCLIVKHSNPTHSFVVSQRQGNLLVQLGVGPL